MIEVTRLNGKQFTLNCDLIMTVESTPDTVVTTTNGKTYVVLESVKEIVDRCAAYKARAFRWPLGEDEVKG